MTMKTKTKIIVILALAFALDFLCYKLYGFGIIKGNLLTIDVDVVLSLKTP